LANVVWLACWQLRVGHTPPHVRPVDLFPIIFFAGLTFIPQCIGTVSVLAACIAFVSISALTNREIDNG
jgi:hypothetical protein